MKIFNLRKVKEQSEIYWKNDWLEFHPEFRMANFRVEKTGYYDARPQVNFTLTTLIGMIGLSISRSHIILEWMRLVILRLGDSISMERVEKFQITLSYVEGVN